MLERRTQILDAAVMTFSRNGFHQTTIEDIRVASGLSRGAIYHYFKSKEDIIDGIRERSLGQADDFYEKSQSSDDATTRLMDLVEASFAVMTRPESEEANRLGVYLWAESLVNPRILAGQLISFTPYLDILAKDVKVMQSEGKIDKELDALTLARVIAGTVLGLQIQLTWEPDGVDVKEAKRVFTSMLTGSFKNSHSQQQDLQNAS